MPMADYRCGGKDCNQVVEIELGSTRTVKCPSCNQSRIWVRVWRPVGIGRVDGAGGSPSR
jgi:DNA-directed RNA polymerase subunit RPC12/RpoP